MYSINISKFNFYMVNIDLRWRKLSLHVSRAFDINFLDNSNLLKYIRSSNSKQKKYSINFNEKKMLFIWCNN